MWVMIYCDGYRTERIETDVLPLVGEVVRQHAETIYNSDIEIDHRNQDKERRCGKMVGVVTSRAFSFTDITFVTLYLEGKTSFPKYF